MKKLIKKIKSQTGESISETLVALLISSLALVMLAGAISSSSGLITKSRDKLDKYYSANEDMIKIKSETTVARKGITITDKANTIEQKQYDVSYYANKEFGKTPVIVYELDETNEETNTP